MVALPDKGANETVGMDHAAAIVFELYWREESRGYAALPYPPSDWRRGTIPMTTDAPPQTIVVTGASSGVGRAIVRRFARKGYRIGLLARGEDGLDAAASEVESGGATALAIPTDVADADAVERAAQRVEDELGPIDVWINDAMTTVFSFLAECDESEFRRATEVTYLGTVWGTKAALRRMLPRDHGTIIQVGSALAYRGIPLQSAYCGAKHAMKGMTESLRAELAHEGSSVHVGMVHLPAVNTPQFSHCRSKFDRHPMPVPPIYQPEVAAEAVELAIRERRREIYLGFPTVMTIIGNKVASGYLDRYLGRNGVRSQLSDFPPDPDNEDGNLFEPVAGDPGAHGVFDDESRTVSPVLWVSRYRRALAVAAGVAAVVGLGWASVADG